MKISRQVGTASEIVNVFIQNATVSTGVGLANVSASSVNFSWCRNNQAAISSGTCSSNTVLGTYSTAALTQLSSTSSLGWYQFGAPNGVFVSGGSAVLHLYGGPAAMAPVPMEIELTATNNQAILPVSVSTMATPVGVSSASVNLGISSAPILLGVSTLSVPVGVSSYSRNAGVSTVAVLVGVSTLSVPVGVSSASVDLGVSTIAVAEKLVGVSTIAVSQKLVGVSTIAVGEKLVGVSTIAVSEKLVGVSTIAASQKLVGVSTVDATGLANFFDTGAVFFSTAVVSSVVYEIATNVSAQVGGLVGVSTITTPVGVSSASVDFGVSTIAAAQKLVGVSTIAVGEKLVGVSTIAAAQKLVGVSTMVTPVGVSSASVNIGVSTATAGVNEAIADAFLNRNISSGGNGGRPVYEAFFAIRNRVDLTNGVVYATDDISTAWSFTTSTSPVDPVVEITPV